MLDVMIKQMQEDS